MFYFGNREILKHYKIGFLCSRKVPADIILKTYDWAIKQRDEGRCIISGFHSKIEKDVFDFLLKGDQPIILVLARGLYKKWDKKLSEEIIKDRLLVISSIQESQTRITSQLAYERNKLIFELADEVFVPYVSKESSLSILIKEYEYKIKEEI